ncbi:MAG TPA: replication endonuclease [Candidatus Aquabacterium excrementipullorum]|nr:replication endonuclease [Candidatus Aquabacterium excrementipullorum]
MKHQAISAARLEDIERAVYAHRDAVTLADARQELADTWAANAAKPVHPDASPAEIRALAERRASLMMDRIAEGGAYGMPDCALVAWLNGQVLALQGRPLRLAGNADSAQARRGIIGRATCKDWWTRALRRAATDAREALARGGAVVCAARQPYVTNETVRRKINQDAANAAMLAKTELENEDGQVFSLARLAEVSVSNPAIRRGELMTRIRGCEEWASAHGMVGVFTTQTTPSRFHAVHRHGGVNEKWINGGEPTPKDGQRWLCKAWARARAELDRRGLGIFGMRVAEPHHDGTPHWHGLFWCKPEHVGRVCVVIRRHWLKDAGDEPGAKQHRFKAKRLEHGGAAGYIAKYIAKGIDDEGSVGATAHHDESVSGTVVMPQGDLFGGGARRVRAWASAHGIRQFQPIGQPPVTVWRELRRISEAQAGMASERIQAMWQAAQREGDKRASWAAYMLRQGGAMVGRGYRVQVDAIEQEHTGRYETTTAARPVGVLDRVEGRKAASDRKEWRPRGAWGPGASSQQQRPVKPPSADGGRALAVHPWTRVNNCTGQPKKKLVLCWREAFPPALVAEIEATLAMREGQSRQTSPSGGASP